MADDASTSLALADLHDQLARANDEIRVLRRERDIAASGRVAYRDVERAAVPCGKSPRVAFLEHSVTVATTALRYIARSDCYHDDDDDDSGCERCEAKAALSLIADWRFGGSRTSPQHRFVGARAERLANGWNRREEKIHAAWCAQLNDHTLGLILCDHKNCGRGMITHSCERPDARDWYVATSVVQWLATNVGMGVLEKADFKYTAFDEDRLVYEDRRAAERITS